MKKNHDIVLADIKGTLGQWLDSEHDRDVQPVMPFIEKAYKWAASLLTAKDTVSYWNELLKKKYGEAVKAEIGYIAYDYENIWYDYTIPDKNIVSKDFSEVKDAYDALCEILDAENSTNTDTKQGKKGVFITLEGPEGSGKTTIMKKIEKLFKDLDYDVVLTREPGGVEIAEEIRNVILDKKNTKMDPLTETLLYAASRRQHLAEVVIPALEAGKIVVCDRYIDSSIAYQGFARGVGAKLVKDINEKVVGDYMPDLTLYFDLDPAVGLERINKNPNREVNRLDVEKLDFHTKVREGYLKIHFLEPDRVKLIHAEQTVEKVWQHTQNVLLDFLRKEEA